MLKIQSDRVIIDDHEPTTEQCETMTLLANALAKSNNFKTVAYRDGYAEFEKVGKADELKFIPKNSLTVNFDAGIQSVAFSYDSNVHTFSTSGERYVFNSAPGNAVILTVNLTSGYSLKSASLGNVSGNTIRISENHIASEMTCTLVSESAATPKVSVDLTTLPGWESLSTGSHNITIVAKADGYRDSEPSAAVSVEKAAPASLYVGEDIIIPQIVRN